MRLLLINVKKEFKSIQTFEHHTDKNLNISDVRGNKSNGQVTGIGQNLTLIKLQICQKNKKFQKILED